MTKRFQLLVDDETLKKLAELDLTLNAAAREKAGNLSKLFAVWRYMDMVADDKLPIHATLDKLHVLNDAALAELQRTADLSDDEVERKERQLIEQKEKQSSVAKQKAGELYEALQLKPSFFGFGVDLKAVFKMFKAKPDK
jgi:hypothetical protein